MYLKIGGNIMDQSRMPLVEALNKFKKQDPVSYYVPGHKNGLLD